MKRKRYFRGNHNNFYYTVDAWKTYEKTNELREGFELDDSSNTKQTIHILEQYGEKKGRIIIQELKKINSLLVSKGYMEKNEDNGYGKAFEVFAVRVLHNFEYKKILEDFIIGGSADGKVDAIVYDNNECRIYQSKIGAANNDWFTKAKRNIREFIEKKTISAPETSDLLRFCEKHKNYFEKEPKYYEISCDGSGSNHIDSGSIFNGYFENLIISQDFKANKFVLKLKLERRISAQDGKTEEKNYSWYDEKAYFTFIKAAELIKQIKTITEGKERAIDKLFGFNVRGFKGKVKEMKQTLTEEPSNFCLYNNGISIVGKCTVGDYLTINEPYVVNGQQTLMNLLTYEGEISDVYVPLFVKNFDTNTTLMNIAKYNNKQSAIKNKDLLSIDIGVRTIQKELFEHSSYYLNILSTGKKNYMSTVKKVFESSKIIELQDFLRVYSIYTKKDNIASWKNNVSSLLEKEYIGKSNNFDISKSEKVCKIIELEREIVNSEKSKYAIASVAIDYLLGQTNLNSEKTKATIDAYIKEKYDDVSPDKRLRNKADLFKGKNDTLKSELDRILSIQ